MLKIETLEAEEAVYDITVEGSENFYANGALVHNCVEIDLPTRPLYSADDPNGWIALCTLSAVNWPKIKTEEQMERVTRILVRALDNLLSYQDYAVPAAKTQTQLFRPLGIGVINFAYFLAKNDAKYDESGFKIVDEFAEMWSFYLIKASMELAKERGACEGYHMTKWSRGILPIDTRAPAIDKLVPFDPKMDWEWLRGEIMKYGIRNATLMAGMPAETSAQVANATNGFEPPRGLVSEKVSKHGVLRQVVPEIQKLKNKYDLLWDQPSPKGYLRLMAIMQKYMDQGISVNQSYNPEFFEDNEISLKFMISDLLEFYKYGGKQLYYFNTYDGQGLESYEEAPAAEIAAEVVEEDCESCKL